jgi:hypothetical protein
MQLSWQNSRLCHCGLCPQILTEAVQTWLAAAEISAGRVFRAVARGGRISDAALADDSASRTVKRYAQRVPDQRGGERGVGVHDD